MAIKDHMQPGMGARQMVRITTVDTSNRIIEAALKDYGTIQIAIFDTPNFFVWPKVLETWLVRKENGIWMLDRRVDIGDDQSINSLNPGEAKINADTIKTISGKSVIAIDDSKVASGQVIGYKNGVWIPVDQTTSGTGSGNTIRYGLTTPSNDLGSNGDFYINTNNNYLYGPKASGSWPSGISLVGPTGSIGSPGAAGATIYSGSGSPATTASSTGAAGDYFFSTDLKTLYGPKTSTWPSTGTSLKGDTGNTGPAGPGRAFNYRSITKHNDILTLNDYFVEINTYSPRLTEATCTVAGNVITYIYNTGSNPHNLSSGDKVEISGFTGATAQTRFNSPTGKSFIVLGITSPYIFTVTSASNSSVTGIAGSGSTGSLTVMKSIVSALRLPVLTSADAGVIYEIRNNQKLNTSNPPCDIVLDALSGTLPTLQAGLSSKPPTTVRFIYNGSAWKNMGVTAPAGSSVVGTGISTS
jgi:hypothetical protein